MELDIDSVDSPSDVGDFNKYEKKKENIMDSGDTCSENNCGDRYY